MRDDERGAAMVEAPMCIAIVLLLAMGILTITQVVWTHLDLSSAVRDATRYAARVEYDPSAIPVTSSRHRTEQQIKEYAKRAASEAGVTVDDVTVIPVTEECYAAPPAGGCAPMPWQDVSTGDVITVTITNVVSNPLYRAGASITNAAAGVFQLGKPFDENGIRITAEANQFVE